MINLLNTTDTLKLVTSAAGSIDVHASYVDNGASTVTPSRTNTGAIATAATTTIIAAPGASTQRNVKTLTIANTHATTSNTITVQHSDGTTTVQLFKATLFAGELLLWDENVGFRVLDASGQPKLAGNARPSTNEFRLSGVTGAPVMTSDSTTLSTIFMTPFRGNQIAIYDGANWQLVSTPEISLAVTGRTTDLPFDIFVFLNSGTPTLEFLDWSSATARATGLVRQDGVWCKSGVLTRRYLGTCRPRSATTFHWVQAGTDAPCKFDLFNADNRVDFQFILKASTASWAYTLATVRQAQASANYQVDIVVGLQEEAWSGVLLVNGSNSTISINRAVGIGFDVTNAFSGNFGYTANTVASIQSLCAAEFRNTPAIGRHFYSWCETSVATGTMTWIGASGTAGANIQSGMVGFWTC